MALTQVDGGLLSPTNGQYTGFKSRIINGAMMIDQRNAGASVSIVSGALLYSVDRWGVFNGSGGATITAQRVTGSGQFSNSVRFTGAAGNSGVSFFQRIESFNVSDLASTQVTLSLLLWASSARTVSWSAKSANTQDNFSAQTAMASGTFSVTTTPTIFTATFTTTAAAINGIELAITLGVLGAGQTINITGVQLEKGSTATSFDYRPYGTELALCQRYYYKIRGDASLNLFIGNGWTLSATEARGIIQFPVTMRTAPTALEQSGTAADYDFQALNSVYICSSVPTLVAASTWSGTVLYTTSGMTAGWGGAIRFRGANGYLGWSAEL